MKKIILSIVVIVVCGHALLYAQSGLIIPMMRVREVVFLKDACEDEMENVTVGMPEIINALETAERHLSVAVDVNSDPDWDKDLDMIRDVLWRLQDVAQ